MFDYFFSSGFHATYNPARRELVSKATTRTHRRPPLRSRAVAQSRRPLAPAHAGWPTWKLLADEAPKETASEPPEAETSGGGGTGDPVESLPRPGPVSADRRGRRRALHHG